MFYLFEQRTVSDVLYSLSGKCIFFFPLAEFCKDCPYPEVVYKNSEGKSFFTPMLIFDSQTNSLRPQSEMASRPCVCCGRTVSVLRHDAYCNLCYTANNPSEEAKKHAAETYEKYKGILPLHVRATSSGLKLCFEDAEIMVFTLGNKKFVFHKFWLDSDGYSKSQSHKSSV